MSQRDTPCDKRNVPKGGLDEEENIDMSYSADNMLEHHDAV